MLSDTQISRLRNGHSVQLKHEQIPNVAKSLQLTDHNLKKMASNYRQGKGVRINLSPDEIQGSGLLSKLKKGVNKGVKYAKIADNAYEKATGEKLSNKLKEKGVEYADLKIGADNRQKLEKAYNTGKKIYDAVNEEHEGGDIFNKIKKGVNKSNKSIAKSVNNSNKSIAKSVNKSTKAIEKGFNKTFNEKNLNIANEYLKDGLDVANSISNRLGLDKVSDIIIDEVAGRTLTPFIGTTATNFITDQAKDQVTKAGYGFNPYMPKDISGGSFRHSGGSFRPMGGAVASSKLPPGIVLLPNGKVRNNNFI